jgi:hypothetical protein
LWRHVECDSAQVEFDHAVDAGEDEEEARAARTIVQIPAEPEYDAAFVFLDDSEAVADREGKCGDQDCVGEDDEQFCAYLVEGTFTSSCYILNGLEVVF